jgi:hypothetical protein
LSIEYFHKKSIIFITKTFFPYFFIAIPDRSLGDRQVSSQRLSASSPALHEKLGDELRWTHFNGIFSSQGGAKMKLPAFIVFLCLFFPCVTIASEIPVGSIKTVKGAATIIRNGNPVETKAGTRVLRNDSLKTGSDGAIGMIFRDDTLLSIGPDSKLDIREFLFSPGEGKLSFVARLLKGTAACISGIIGKLSPDSFRFETPVANIGIRGTKFAVKVEGADGESR